MIKRVLSIVLLAFVGLTAIAQEPQNNAIESRHELSVGVGYITTPQLYDIVVDFFKLFAGCRAEHYGFDGSFNLDYGYHVSPKCVITGTVSYNNVKSHMYNNDTYKGDENDTYLAVMPGFKCNWINKQHFALYSRVSVGLHLLWTDGRYTVVSEDNTDELTSTGTGYAIAYQVSPIGVEFGSKLRGYVEAGIGTAGLVSTGVRYKF